MKIYVAGHNQEDARSVAQILSDAGHKITSSWINEDFLRTSQYSDSDRERIANKDVSEVLISDAVVMLSSPRRVPGGKFVEFGIAIGSGKKLFLIGHRENMLMWHGKIDVFCSVEDLVKNLQHQI